MEAENLRIEVNGVLLDLKTFIEEYNIRIGLTEEVSVEGLDRRHTRLMKVKLRDFNTYLFETPYMIRYMTHPHIVGDSLRELLRKDIPLVRGILKKFSLERFGKPTVIDQINIDLGFPKLENVKGPENLVLIVLAPLEYNIEQIYEGVRNRGSKITVFLFLGPMSNEDIARLGDLSNSLGADSIFLSNAFIGGKDHSGNIYAYGPDINMLRYGRVVEIGSIIDIHTLSRILREYPPSTDVSKIERRLSGDRSYLQETLEGMIFLMEQPIFDPWQIEIMLREAKSLKRQLERNGHGRNSSSTHSK